MLILDVFLRYGKLLVKKKKGKNACMYLLNKKIIEVKELDTSPFELINSGFGPLVKFKMFPLLFFQW